MLESVPLNGLNGDDNLSGEEEPLQRKPIDPFEEFCLLLHQPPSRFPPMNRLLKCAQSMLVDYGWEPPPEEWSLLRQQFDLELQEVSNFLDWSIRFQEKTEEFVDQIARVFSLLEFLFSESARLDESVRRADPVEFVFALEQLAGALEELADRLKTLRQFEADAPVYSEIPYVQELFRLAEAVRRGALEKSLLKERLEVYEEVQRQTRESILESGGLQGKELKRLEDSFALQNDALDLLFAYLETDNLSALDKGLECLNRSGRLLLDLRQELLALHSPKDSIPRPDRGRSFLPNQGF